MSTASGKVARQEQLVTQLDNLYTLDNAHLTTPGSAFAVYEGHAFVDLVL